jgi:hypothetical protein
MGKQSHSNMYHLIQHLITLHIVYLFCTSLAVNGSPPPPQQHQPDCLCNLDAVCFYEVRAEVLNIVWMNFSLHRLNPYFSYT